MLQAFDTCGLAESPAAAILSQLTLLSLRNCRLTTLADALPTDAVRNLRVLDLSGNPLGRPPNANKARWSPANLTAFSAGNWASLKVLGIRPLAQGKVTRGLEGTVTALKQLLRRQADAAQPPRPPPVVIYSEPMLCGVLHMPDKLLQPADKLAVVDDSL
jgi:Leucine Rich Repeat